MGCRTSLLELTPIFSSTLYLTWLFSFHSTHPVHFSRSPLLACVVAEPWSHRVVGAIVMSIKETKRSFEESVLLSGFLNAYGKGSDVISVQDRGSKRGKNYRETGKMLLCVDYCSNACIYSFGKKLKTCFYIFSINRITNIK